MTLGSAIKFWLRIGCFTQEYMENTTVALRFFLGSICKSALATCETSQVLFAGVPDVFSQGCPVFAPPTDWSVSYELK